MFYDLTYSDATALAELIRSRKVSSVAVMQAYLDSIAALNPALNAIVTVNPHGLAQARCTASPSPSRDRSTRAASPPGAAPPSSPAACPTPTPPPSRA